MHVHFNFFSIVLFFTVIDAVGTVSAILLIMSAVSMIPLSWRQNKMFADTARRGVIHSGTKDMSLNMWCSHFAVSIIPQNIFHVMSSLWVGKKMRLMLRLKLKIQQ
jgi:hypothetical protein